MLHSGMVGGYDVLMEDEARRQRSEAARLLATLPRQVRTGTCVVCGKVFQSTRAGRRLYCHDSCRTTAYRQRLKAAGAQPQGGPPHPTP